MADTTSLLQLIGTIRASDGSDLRRAQADLFNRFHARLLRFASTGVFSEARRHHSASDVVLIGLNSFLRTIRSGKYHEEDPDSSWEALAFAIVRNKLLKTRRAATSAKRDRGRESEIDSAALGSPEAVEAFEPLLRWIESELPEADGSRALFRLSIVEGMTDEAIAKQVDLSTRTIRERRKVVLSHIVDLALNDSGLSDFDREVVALVLDPRTRLRPGNQRVGAGVRIHLAAERLGITPEDAKIRLLRALETLVTRRPDEDSNARA